MWFLVARGISDGLDRRELPSSTNDLALLVVVQEECAGKVPRTLIYVLPAEESEID